eukprot:6213273-Pleurochrysis_carterae.AAC.6
MSKKEKRALSAVKNEHKSTAHAEAQAQTRTAAHTQSSTTPPLNVLQSLSFRPTSGCVSLQLKLSATRSTHVWSLRPALPGRVCGGGGGGAAAAA